MNAASYLTIYLLAGSAGMMATLVYGLHAALRRAGWPDHDRRAAVGVLAFVLVGWFALAVILAWFGAYQGAAGRAPTIQYGIVLPILAGAVLVWRSRAVWSVLAAVPQGWVVGVQLYRVMGGVFLVLFAAGHAPGLFALPAGLGDILVGLSAPLVAYAYARRPRERAGSVIAWNVFGLADLAIALTTGLLTAPSVLQAFAFDRPNSMIDVFPLVLIPVFLVPVSVLLHIVSLVKLRREGVRQQNAGFPSHAGDDRSVVPTVGEGPAAG